MSIESHINLAIGEVQAALRMVDGQSQHRKLKDAMYELNLALEELRSLRAQINKIEAGL